MSVFLYKIKDFQVIDLEYFMTCLFLVIVTLLWSVSLLCDCLSHLYSCFHFSYSYVFICYLLGHALPHYFSLFIWPPAICCTFCGYGSISSTKKWQVLPHLQNLNPNLKKNLPLIYLYFASEEMIDDLWTLAAFSLIFRRCIIFLIKPLYSGLWMIQAQVRH